jgi:NAD(P)-dependent dehydrogenase (short-subunit alcohol dehydrogenase family)
MKDLKDKVAIVTGGAGGIGFSVCEALGKAGGKVFARLVTFANTSG